MIIDPPRKGCSASLIEKLSELSQKGCKRIVYMSCKPATLARDLVLCVKKEFIQTEL